MITKYFKHLLVACIFCWTPVFNGFAQYYYDDTLRFQSALNLDVIFKNDPQTPRGKLIVQKKPNDTPFDFVEVNIFTDFLIPENKFNNVLIYQNIAQIAPYGVDYHAKTYEACIHSFGIMAADFNALGPWVSDNIKVSVQEVKEFFVKEVYKKPYGRFFQSKIPVRIEIYKYKDTELEHVYLYGMINEVTDLINDKNLRFDPAFQYGSSTDNNHAWSDSITYNIKNPPQNLQTVDIVTAAHRGFWGKNLGAGPAENTPPSIEEAAKYTNIVETDITITKDDSVVVSHDYNLQRLTDYIGADWKNKFLYNTNFNEIENLHLRRKDTTATEFKFRQLKDIIKDVKNKHIALHLDIKEIINRSNPLDSDQQTNCTATCDYQSTEKKLESWIYLYRRILDIIRQENAWSYVAIKTQHTPMIIKSKLREEIYNNPEIEISQQKKAYNQYMQDMRKLLFLPVIQPNRTIDQAVKTISGWYNEEPNSVLAFETNFLTPVGKAEPFSIGIGANKKDYQNVLHYVLDATGLRPAFYSEEPAGPKGIVDRYAQWRFKNLSTDFRGDHFWLMSIPYFSQSLVTTDRVDIWNRIKEIYAPQLMYSMSTEHIVNSSSTLAENLNVNTRTKITAMYNGNILSVNGLDKNDIDGYISLYDLQGRLIYREKVTNIPQMNIFRNLQSGIYIVTLSGYREVNIKLIIK
jgi:hypothetical protein